MIQKDNTNIGVEGTITNWLRVKNIPFCNTILFAQVCEMVKAHKSKYKAFLADESMAAANRTALRLSLYHPDLNSLLADVKQWVGR
jgi:hypothetical protein